MGITIFFGIMSVAMIIGTAIFVRKNNRLYKLNEVINKYANEANQKYLGKIVA